MLLQDFLLPNENVRFESTGDVKYGGKGYRVIISDKRCILYARRGLLVKNDDVVSEKLDDCQGIKYNEKGIIGKKGIIEIHSKTKFQLEGSAIEMKALYQNLLQSFD